jgi:hypothetical protein
MRKPPPRTHPAPHQSALWAHWTMIGELRRSKKTWKQIAAELKESCAITISAGSVRNFFKRLPNRAARACGVLTELRDEAQHENKKDAARCQRIKAEMKGRDPTAATHPFVLPSAANQLEDADGDPFSTKVIEYDPWKPQRKIS